MADKNEYLDEAYHTLEHISADEQKRLEYEARERAIRDANHFKHLMETAEERGWASGMKKGMDEGLEKGMEKGIEKGIEKDEAIRRHKFVCMNTQRRKEILPLPQPLHFTGCRLTA